MSLLDRILLPVDFSERFFGAARYIEALTDKQQSELFLVHVSTPLSYEMSALDVGGTVISELNSDRSADLREQLDEFLKDELAPYRVHRHLLEGDPAKRIVEFAHNNHINLIAMPTHATACSGVSCWVPSPPRCCTMPIARCSPASTSKKHHRWRRSTSAG